MTNDETFSVAELLAFHKATGISVIKAKTELLKMEPELRSRLFKAALAQPGKWGHLHDPIEDDVATCELFQAATRAAEVSVGPTAGRGVCHLIWREKKRILAAQGIAWFSPVEMNPWTVYD